MTHIHFYSRKHDIYVGAAVVKLFATVKLDHEYDENLNDLQSKEYQHFQQEITALVSYW